VAMSDHRIQQLELAVLHLTRAVNDLVGVIQAQKIEAKQGPINLPDENLHGNSETLLQAASQHVREAFETIAEKV
jgi:hypothetical protein